MLDAVVESTSFADTLDQLLLFAFAIVAAVGEHGLLDWFSAPTGNVPLHLGVGVLARLAWHRFLAQWAHWYRTIFFCTGRGSRARRNRNTRRRKY